MSMTVGVPDLAHIIYVSALQPSEEPTPEQVRAAVDAVLDDGAACACCVAQEAGDHPEIYTVRMRWALRAAGLAFPGGGAPA